MIGTEIVRFGIAVTLISSSSYQAEAFGIHGASAIAGNIRYVV